MRGAQGMQDSKEPPEESVRKRDPHKGSIFGAFCFNFVPTDGFSVLNHKKLNF